MKYSISEDIWAIIPARGGSKRLPGKNIKSLCGNPLINWTIKAALGSKYIDRIFLSTDSQEIIRVVKEFDRIEVPFIRREEFSSDTATSVDVVLDFFSHHERIPRYFILLQPTSPLRTSLDIDNSIKLALKSNLKSVIGVSKLPHPLSWVSQLGEGNSMAEFCKRKTLVDDNGGAFYKINGAVYLLDTVYFMEKKTFLTQESIAFEMPIERSVDIDTEMDFWFAEAIINNLSRGE